MTEVVVVVVMEDDIRCIFGLILPSNDFSARVSFPLTDPSLVSFIDVTLCCTPPSNFESTPGLIPGPGFDIDRSSRSDLFNSFIADDNNLIFADTDDPSVVRLLDSTLLVGHHPPQHPQPCHSLEFPLRCLVHLVWYVGSMVWVYSRFD